MVFVSDNDLAWLQNNGDEGFSQQTIASTNADGLYTPYSLRTADLDADGDLDIILGPSSSSGDVVAWYQNNGEEGFSKQSIYALSEGASLNVYDLKAIDFDGDEDVDVVSVSKELDKVYWHENDGSENFTTHTVDSQIDGPQGLQAINLDGDSDLDIVAVGDNDNSVVWYENNGSQSFSKHEIDTDANDPLGVTAADLDADGDMDVLASSSGGDAVFWYVQDADGNFDKQIFATGIEGAQAVSTADLDGDEDLDVVATGWKDGKVIWFENSEAVAPMIAHAKYGSLVLNSANNVEWSTKFSEDMVLPTVAAFLPTKALRVGANTNIVTEESGELVSIRYGQTDGQEDRTILVFEIEVEADHESYQIRMQYGDTGHDNSGLTDLAGNAFAGENAHNGFINTVGLRVETLSKQGVLIYPNPVDRHLHLVYPSATQATYTVYDLTGKTRSTHHASGQNHQLNVSGLSKGVYLLKAEHGAQTGVFRFVKE
ncbi:MAG: T9SS type A sorting domain-containing protein [Flavobacteriaceae bacterium]|nr:T9SS type A sorting domain-containing protein [Flavobacteriaceae bacterium]